MALACSLNRQFVMRGLVVARRGRPGRPGGPWVLARCPAEEPERAMRTTRVALLACLICFLPFAARAGAGPGGKARKGERAGAAAESYRWVMVGATEMMFVPGGAQQVVELCERASEAGYNGLLLWDTNLWDQELPQGYL